MNNDVNPYAPPSARVDEVVQEGSYWREGKNVLFISRDSDLPPRCVKCNAPAVTPTKSRKLYWHHSGYYLLILFNILIYAIVASFVRKKFVVSPGLCLTHAATRKRQQLIAWSLLGVGIISIWISVQESNGPAALVAVAAIIGAIIFAMIGNRILYPIEITEKYARLRGCGEPFLASVRKDRLR